VGEANRLYDRNTAVLAPYLRTNPQGTGRYKSHAFDVERMLRRRFVSIDSPSIVTSSTI
jgi:hypothetical protein